MLQLLKTHFREKRFCYTQHDLLMVQSWPSICHARRKRGSRNCESFIVGCTAGFQVILGQEKRFLQCLTKINLCIPFDLGMYSYDTIHHMRCKKKNGTYWLVVYLVFCCIFPSSV